MMQIVWQPYGGDALPLPQGQRDADLIAQIEAILTPVRQAWLQAHPHTHTEKRGAAPYPVGESQAEGVDRDEWVECACQLLSALRSGHPVYVTRLLPGMRDIIGLAGAPAFDPAAPVMLAGRSCEHDPLFTLPGLVFPDLVRSAAARGQYVNEAALAAMGRLCRTVSFDSENKSDVAEIHAVLLDLARQGHRTLFFKVIYKDKYLTAPLTLPDADYDDPVLGARIVAGSVMDLLDYDYVHLDGRKNAAVVQAFVPMRDEYRIIVLDGVPVMGAPKVIDATPLDAPASAWDIRFPGDGQATGRLADSRQDQALVDRYRAFFDEHLPKLSASHPDLRDYTFDVAMGQFNENGTIIDRPVLVELNPLDAFGMFATDFGRVIAAVADRQPRAERTAAPKARRPAVATKVAATLSPDSPLSMAIADFQALMADLAKAPRSAGHKDEPDATGRPEQPPSIAPSADFLQDWDDDPRPGADAAAQP